MARETERLVTEAGRNAVLLPGNIGDSAICQSVARKAIRAVDILVNNAAFQRTHEKLKDIPDDKFEELSTSRTCGSRRGGTFVPTTCICLTPTPPGRGPPSLCGLNLRLFAPPGGFFER
jgi:hypothetical protein